MSQPGQLHISEATPTRPTGLGGKPYSCGTRGSVGHAVACAASEERLMQITLFQSVRAAAGTTSRTGNAFA
jgi:hypothetical protein